MSNKDEFIKNLSSEDERERAFAVEDIVYEGIPEAIDLLVAQLEIESSQFVREVIIRNLRILSSSELVEKTIPLLHSDDAFIRNAVIEILSEQDELAISYIEPLLDNPDKDIRKFAVDILFQLQSTHSAAVIARGLDDPDINIKITAAEYLGRLEARAHIAGINRLFLNSRNLLLRCTCLETMAILGDEESARLVAEFYPQPEQINELELYSYLKYLARQGKEEYLPFVFSLMKSKGKLMAKEIINTIEGILRRSGAVYLPAGMVEDLALYIASDINVINKYELLVFLGHFKNSEIGPLLASYACSAEKLLCLGAVEGLGFLGDPEQLPLLLELKKQIGDDELLEAVGKAIIQLAPVR
ncbi:HEAT repeat domain-containing protein [Syntrophomonas wolfei]|uniref:HEAT repeat domain-containing protein n=1 Tax=Syntrophomonas wolfei subsp. wolfei (strain DSM 2245B / Goettingen) TaxID=335541 RepID=Q0AWY9_SYNWW|nr:HEAT repeat domain-containing protein [Syntrophomonas wolfei]ABI68765.1 hypothetical protein Swol_1458 [Syntrophomonas wolfei subsp. wolfei str. Goettingen G311]